MHNYQDVFERVERKYLLSAEQYSALMKTVGQFMRVDQYGKTTITNLYYDTDDYALIRQSLEHPVYKEKLRLRSYGIATQETTVFPEIKKKYKGIVYKRRVAMPLRDAAMFLDAGILEGEPSQIHREISYFLQRYPVSPKVFLAYDRVAMFNRSKNGLRVTFDRNIRFRDTNLTLTDKPSGTLLLPEQDVLMEVKFIGAMPIWLSRSLSELSVFQTSFSKYGACYSQYLIKKQPVFGGAIHVA